MNLYKLTLLSFLTLPLFGQDPACEPPPYPFGLSGMYLQVGDAAFRDPDVPKEHLSYTQSNAAFAYTHACNPYWGLIFGSGWVGTELLWKENPFFQEDHFNYVNLSLGAYSSSMPCWTWIMTGSMLIDTAVLDLGNYALYQGVLYGKYELYPCILFDIGCILEVGLNKGKIWPIFGLEWDPCERFSLNLVYPLDVSIEYDLFPWATVGGSIRFLRDRHRVLETEPLPLGIYEYETEGAEFDLTLNPLDCLLLTGFVGRTFPGSLKVTDQRNHCPAYAKFKGAFYAGASAALTF
jgi:hypothetical protein